METKHLEWATEHVKWTTLQRDSSVIFSDESKFSSQASVEKQCVRRESNEAITLAVWSRVTFPVSHVN